jgi:hypothetical protein
VEKQGKTLEDRTDMLNQMLALCGTIDKTEATKTRDILLAEQAKIEDNDIK